jgi:hypothetical protein
MRIGMTLAELSRLRTFVFMNNTLKVTSLPEEIDENKSSSNSNLDSSLKVEHQEVDENNSKITKQPQTIESQTLYPPPILPILPTDKSTDLTCACCISDYEPQEVIRELPCLHWFHQDCIDEWLKAKPSCPICTHDARIPIISLNFNGDVNNV